jgi:hypothetical protein
MVIDYEQSDEDAYEPESIPGTDLPPKLEEFLPKEFYPDVLLVHDADDRAFGDALLPNGSVEEDQPSPPKRHRARLTDTNVCFLPQHQSVVQIRPVLHPFIFVPPTWVESATTLPSTVHLLLSQSHLPPIHVPEMGKSPSSPR